MENFEKQLFGDILIEKINLPRATTNEAGIIKERLFEDIQLNNKKIIVYISNNTFVDSSFIGALVVSLKKIRETGGDIKIVIGSSSFTGGIINSIGFLRVFETFSSLKDAIKSFRS
ncbi:MAG: STAS domain-containing protein [Bacteroidetes bacterium]|nr:STAS domain-containing protein [Bacteroidota bacterium]